MSKTLRRDSRDGDLRYLFLINVFGTREYTKLPILRRSFLVKLFCIFSIVQMSFFLYGANMGTLDSTRERKDMYTLRWTDLFLVTNASKMLYARSIAVLHIARKCFPKLLL